jgi:hypothetical protein
MKILTSSTTGRKRQDGLAVVIMLILIVMVLGFILANTSVLTALHNDVKRIEQRQIRRINSLHPPASTNSPTAEGVK